MTTKKRMLDKESQTKVNEYQDLIGLLIEKGIQVKVITVEGETLFGVDVRGGLLNLMLLKNNELYDMHAVYWNIKEGRYWLINESEKQNAEITSAEIVKTIKGLEQAVNLIEHVKQQAGKTCSKYQ